jgi:glycerophosphoryl diester phosphodiesterase
VLTTVIDRRSAPRPVPVRSSVAVHGHRGAAGLVVESTLEGFTAAYALGVAAIEVDVRLTADGHPVVWHDPVLHPTKCRPTGPDLLGARVADLTLAQLRTVDVGSHTLPQFAGQRAAPGARISTLQEVLAHGLERAPDVWWTLDVKSDPLEPDAARTRRVLLHGILEALHDLGVQDRCLVHSFDWSVLELARAEAPGVARSALAEAGVTWRPGSPWTGSVRVRDHGSDVCGGAAEVGAHVVSPEHSLVDASLVERAHVLGLSVLPWTVNDPERIQTMIDLGVDGIVSDYPDRALALLTADDRVGRRAGDRAGAR